MTDKPSVEIFNSWDLYKNIVLNNWMRHEQMAQFIHKSSTGLQLKVLDLGCGDGQMARQGLCDCQIEKYVGIDLSQDALDHLKRAGGLGPNPQTVLGDIQESIQQLPDQSFDLVLASYSLHHFQSDQKLVVLKEIRRILSPKGLFLWIDIACLEEEDRSGYLSRIEHEIESKWILMPPKHREDAIEHIFHHDFPEKQSWMIQAWEKSSETLRPSPSNIQLNRRSVGYRDPFYVALQLR